MADPHICTCVECKAPLLRCALCLFKKHAGALAKKHGPLVVGMIMPKIEEFLRNLPGDVEEKK
jgi:hypothetical protein